MRNFMIPFIFTIPIKNNYTTKLKSKNLFFKTYQIKKYIFAKEQETILCLINEMANWDIISKFQRRNYSTKIKLKSHYGILYKANVMYKQ